LEANQPLKLTGEAGSNDGVVVVGEEEPGATPSATATPTPTPGSTDAPTDTAIELPDSITGSNAAQETCSNGNLRGSGG
jgi:hypothetical protein